MTYGGQNTSTSDTLLHIHDNLGGQVIKTIETMY